MLKRMFFTVFIVITAIVLVGAEENWQRSIRSDGSFSLIGTKKGLFFSGPSGEISPLWTEGEVRKIVSVPYGVFLMTDLGILFSGDLRFFRPMNEGLNVKTVKLYRNGEKSFRTEIQELKDLETDPSNPSNLVTCSKDGVFYSLNAGKSWTCAPNPAKAPGIKAVSIVSSPELAVFLAHPFKGVYKKNIAKNGPWTDVSKGLLEATQSYEEVSDMKAVPEGNGVRLFAANNFTPNLYVYNFRSSSWSNVYKGRERFESMESLQIGEGEARYVGKNGFIKIRNGHAEPDGETAEFFNNIKHRLLSADADGILSTVSFSGGKETRNLSELWLVSEPELRPTVTEAMHRKGLYVAAHFLKKPRQLESLLGLMDKAGLNALVIDMKDDWGKLRFDPQSELLKKMGRTGNALDLESFTKAMKEKGIYLIARLVLFQDRILYQYNQFEFAVKDKNGGPWQGRKKKKNGETKRIEEYWVDPYCERVWEYNVEIAKELIRRGFNEIQFDYVRFTTDGDNLEDTAYSFRDKGMDKESAIMSFLNYARENISAPISIDIYGANGWWRTSARTGQDVELFSRYVDAICPMYYPSHFDPAFELYPPADKRPYRIYYFGSLRNYYFARKSVTVRPYVQTFKMNYLKYDRDYYGPDYVLNEITGVDDSIGQGYTFWNMGVKYQILTNVYQIR